MSIDLHTACMHVLIIVMYRGIGKGVIGTLRFL